MSNDSREAFEEAFRLRNVSYPLTRSTTGLRDYKEERTEGAWQGWQAAQSRHAAEREALVRKCAETCHEYVQAYRGIYTPYDIGVYSASMKMKAKILALLDSGSQG
jgi:hypothetical protein